MLYRCHCLPVVSAKASGTLLILMTSLMYEERNEVLAIFWFSRYKLISVRLIKRLSNSAAATVGFVTGNFVYLFSPSCCVLSAALLVLHHLDYALIRPQSQRNTTATFRVHVFDKKGFQRLPESLKKV